MWDDSTHCRADDIIGYAGGWQRHKRLQANRGEELFQLNTLAYDASKTFFS
jgi:hypothetical protein